MTRPFSYSRAISLRILTKRGCNGAACHGGVKGRGGFKLSANALYPKDDYEWITKGGTYQVLTAEVKGQRVPRVDLATSREEPSARQAHHGRPARRRQAVSMTDSEDYKTMLDWVKRGALTAPERGEGTAS